MVRDIYETAKSKEEIERRLRGLVEYMKWKSEETLAACQHYFDEQLDADTREQFHLRMHQEIERCLKEQRQGKRKKPASHKSTAQETSVAIENMPQFADEPDLAFLYSLGGMA